MRSQIFLDCVALSYSTLSSLCPLGDNTNDGPLSTLKHLSQRKKKPTRCVLMNYISYIFYVYENNSITCGSIKLVE